MEVPQDLEDMSQVEVVEEVAMKFTDQLFLLLVELQVEPQEEVKIQEIINHQRLFAFLETIKN